MYQKNLQHNSVGGKWGGGQENKEVGELTHYC